MRIENFDPRGKEFHFKLDKYSCYRCQTGKCSLDNVTLDELYAFNVSNDLPAESSKDYCIGMAKLFLEGEFETPAFIYKDSCGHYSIDDGQHRTCVVAHLLDKGASVVLNANVKEQDMACYMCGMKEKIKNKEANVTWFDKTLKTKPYRELINIKNSLYDHNFLYKL
ncbi:hypothetical protein GKD46_20825 [Parabacteroides distasonis]|nr:hypothetical protein [Parabacteroides distasonis]